MSPNPLSTPLQQRQSVDDTVRAYVGWREECTAVRDAYRRWATAPAADAALAFGAYESALDREEGAATVYAGLMGGVGHLVGTVLDHSQFPANLVPPTPPAPPPPLGSGAEPA
jgi:hypothetical protein